MTDRPSLRDALRALRSLVEDPDDTAHVFTIVSALAGRTPERLHRRFTGSAEGRRLLEAKPSLLSVLADRERLRAMPEGSLGRAYLTFMEREQITAEGLVDASLAGGRPDVPEDEQFVAERLRDSHDLWHAVTGYQGDVKGEAAILAFSLAQTGNPGLLAIVLLGIAHTRSLDFTAMVAGGFARGLHARDLLTVHWESLLALPVEEVRWRLGVRPAPEYEPLRTSELRAQGMLRPRAA